LNIIQYQPGEILFDIKFDEILFDKRFAAEYFNFNIILILF